MRDPKRIPKVMDKLTALWLKNPDLRFFQLIQMINPHKLDLFNTEEDWLKARIEELLKA